MAIIDRREEHNNKSLTSRSKFIKRYKGVIKDAAANQIKKAKGFSDIVTGKEGQETEIKIKRKTIEEPNFIYGKGGVREHVLPGNDQFTVGDTIERPPEGGQGGRGREGSPDGDGEDEFSFYLNREEFLNVLLDDLCLPDMVKKNLAYTVTQETVNAGYNRNGSPGNMDLKLSFRRSMSRRIGLKRKIYKTELALLQEQFFALADIPENKETLEKLQVLIDAMMAKLRAIPYIDPDQDIRYRNREIIKNPTVSSVMICLMDVSGSMTENLKENAKYFYLLLYMFLNRQYSNVQLVFVRHTSTAEEVDEETFFYDKQTGGTVVSAGLEKVISIINERYDTSIWNIYLAQASDGDNYSADSAKCKELLKVLLTKLQYMVYVEMNDGDMHNVRDTDLWASYKEVNAPNLAMQKIKDKSHIYPVFVDLFSKK